MEMGNRVLYGDRVVYVLQTPKAGSSHVLIQDGGKQLRVALDLLKPLPEGATVTTQHRIGKGTVIPKEIRTQYVQHKVKTGSNKSYAIDNNDDTANRLRGSTLEDVYTATVDVLAQHGIETSVAALKAKYETLNVGMQRMNLGNLIRGAAKKAETQKRKDAEKAKRDEAKAIQAEAKAVKDAEKKAAKEAAAAAKAEAAAQAAALVAEQAPATTPDAGGAAPDAGDAPATAPRRRGRKTAPATA